MASPRDLLHRLFEYIGEQLKDTDPRAYRLSEVGRLCVGAATWPGCPRSRSTSKSRVTTPGCEWRGSTQPRLLMSPNGIAN